MAPPEYRFNWHHDVFYAALDRFARGECKRLIIQAPPGHGKSEGTSRICPAYILGKNPDARIIACSHTSDLAGEMNRDVQGIIDSDRYAMVFPGTRLAGDGRKGRARRTEKIFDVIGRRGFYKAAGVGQGITGRRADFGLIDDPIKDRETANSPTMRESIWRWYTGSFLTRQAKGAAICITLTRWHEDDLVGRILAKEPDKWEVITLPAIADGVHVHPLDPRKPGEALWPWFKSLAELIEFRELEPRDFYALYQQDPRKEGGAEWPSEWFDGILFDEWPADVGNFTRVMALDPSRGKADKSGDYSAWIMLGVDATQTPEMLWVDADMSNTRHVNASKDSPGHSIVGDGYDLMLKWMPVAELIETNGFQQLVAEDFAQHCAQRQMLSVPIFTRDSTEPKQQRIRSLGPYFARRRIRIRNTPGGRLLVKQLRDFPNGDHDDGPDALKLAEMMANYILCGDGAFMAGKAPKPMGG